MTTNNQNNSEEQQAAKSFVSFFYNLIAFAGAGLIVKLAWNLGIASLFPGKIPVINYIHAMTWLTMLYIAARTIAAGFMSEVEKTVSNLVDQFEGFIKTAQEYFDVASSKTAGDNNDHSNLN